IETEQGQIRNHLAHPAEDEPRLLTAAPAAQVSGTRDEVHLFHETPALVLGDDDDFLTAGNDIVGTAGAGQTHLRSVVSSDDARIHVAEPVHLSGSDESVVKEASLPVQKNVRNAR